MSTINLPFFLSSLFSFRNSETNLPWSLAVQPSEQSGQGRWCLTMSLAKGIFGTVAKQYQSIVASRVAAMGLKYEDLLVESDDVEKALNRIPTDVKVAR